MTEPVSGRKPVLALLMRLLCAAALALPAFGAQAAVVFTTLHSFQVFPNGANPYAGLVLGRDGNFYGTTSSDGASKSGTVFKISTNGVLTTLYSFSGGNDGANPYAGLVQGRDGNFYGTTYGGGTNGYGTVFKISSNGALTSLYSFTSFSLTGTNDGANPQAGLVQGSDGYLYGTTACGGSRNLFYGNGTVFKISTNGTYTSLYSFTGGNDGANPYAGLVQGSDGYFYGTSWGGYGSVNGTVFKISANGLLTTLHNFGGNDGSNPYAGLVQGSDGYFYGTTQSDPANPFAFFALGAFYPSTVFKISSNGAFTNLYSFTGGNDGVNPQAALVQGSDGYLYGTTYGGGTNNAGTVFQISTNGVLTSLYSFTRGNDGANPYAGLVQGSDGNFYGTTGGGGTNNGGVVFKIGTTGALTNLYSFPGLNDGANPSDSLVRGSDGNFYGTTPSDGANKSGTVFQISPTGALTTLYSFTGGTDGASPAAALVQGSDGNFYGTTLGKGGGDQLGSPGGVNSTVFQITTNGMLTTLYSSFPLVYRGTPFFSTCQPNGLVQGSDGNFYGTTYSGGTNGYGTVFKISTNGVLTTLYPFGSILDADGNPLDGANPQAGLVQGSDGNFYGTASGGGTNVHGTVFRISTNGTLTSLYSFTGSNDGANPYAGLVQGSDGNFYGTTYGGGTNGYGTVFKISLNGALTSLYSFTSRNDGASPQAGLVQGSDGSFYGTTVNGGQGGAGTVFRLTIVPQPQLNIVPSGPYVILAWPTNYTGFTLQSTTNLGSSAVWSTNSSPPVVIGGDNVVINTASGKQQFYRLSQ